jgi:plastocyanin
MTRLAIMLTFCALPTLFGCGGHADDAQKVTIEAHPALGKDSEVRVPVAEGQGALQGQVQFSGAAPKPSTIAMSADPYCVGLNPNGAASEELIVSASGALRNAFVYIKGNVSGKYPTLGAAQILDQQGCRYEPHVIGVQVDQPISIINSDATLHNVHALPANSKQFNLGMPIQGMKMKKKFSTPEVMVKMKCDVHPWMSAYIGVLSHPFFAVTGDDGSFSITGVPAGNYTLVTWHEKLGESSQAITVVRDQTTSVDFSFSG